MTIQFKKLNRGCTFIEGAQIMLRQHSWGDGGGQATATIRPCRATEQHRTILEGGGQSIATIQREQQFLFLFCQVAGAKNLDILSRFRKCASFFASVWQKGCEAQKIKNVNARAFHGSQCFMPPSSPPPEKILGGRAPPKGRCFDFLRGAKQAIFAPKSGQKWPNFPARAKGARGIPQRAYNSLQIGSNLRKTAQKRKNCFRSVHGSAKASILPQKR